MKSLITAAKRLRTQLDELNFGEPVTHVYNPLHYAWKAHQQYLAKAHQDVDVIFLGMNPGPWGMAQTGVPFGEVNTVREWLKITAAIDRPTNEHPKRPVEGLRCERSEVSGRRLWGLFQDRFTDADTFFQKHFVANYCPLVFMEQSGRNRTPDKLSPDERTALTDICDQHLATMLAKIRPRHVVGVGNYAEKCLTRVMRQHGWTDCQVSRILHPSPASPAANRDWSGTATKQLTTAGVW